MKSLLLMPLVALLFGCGAKLASPAVDLNFQPSRDFLRDESQIGPQEENTIGRAVTAKLLGTYPARQKERLTAYVNQVGAAVAAASPRPETFAGYSFVVVQSDEVNAMAAPGGYILISRGLLKLLSDEDMLAAVLAHEVSHVVLRHGLKSIKPEHLEDSTPFGAAVIACAIDCSDISEHLLAAFIGAINDIVEKLTIAGYSREQEYEADKMAAETLARAGYDPGALQRVLHLLAGKSSSGGWFSTHPKPGDRVEALSSKTVGGSASSPEYVKRKKRFSAVSALF